MKFNKLTTEEEKVITNKGTEKPFTGEYDNFFKEGVYLCRQCNAVLYESKDKFDAKCGWPSFDDEVPGAVKRQTDADGSRTEILCANCGAHLGHVFEGEGMTPKNIRHCVNSISLRFISKSFDKKEESYAVFGGGCFWCLEAIFKELKGVSKVISGYAGGQTPGPTYEKVSSGSTGHAEVVKVIFDPETISYRDLLEVFFYVHDPTTLNRQGNDVGEQYRSLILYKTLDQKEEVEKIIRELEEDKAFESKIVTEVEPLMDFYEAEEYHQKYFEKNPHQPYCQAVIAPKVKSFKDKFEKLIK